MALDPAPVYISAPYDDPDPQRVTLNTLRSAWLARLALVEGLAPVLIHPLIPVLFDGGRTPANTAWAERWAHGLVRAVAAHPAGRFWALQADGHTAPTRMVAEHHVWAGVRRGRRNPVASWARKGAWEDWVQPARQDAVLVGLHGLLVKPPAARTLQELLAASGFGLVDV